MNSSEFSYKNSALRFPARRTLFTTYGLPLKVKQTAPTGHVTGSKAYRQSTAGWRQFSDIVSSLFVDPGQSSIETPADGMGFQIAVHWDANTQSFRTVSGISEMAQLRNWLRECLLGGNKPGRDGQECPSCLSSHSDHATNPQIIRISGVRSNRELGDSFSKLDLVPIS
ncbi:MAG: hypothetical protein JWM11_3714 [Planctomycetaceae bacterium]|nr:hypothetical protein [Planctomycetaceae bacterium]